MQAGILKSEKKGQRGKNPQTLITILGNLMLAFELVRFQQK